MGLCIGTFIVIYDDIHVLFFTCTFIIQCSVLFDRFYPLVIPLSTLFLFCIFFHLALRSCHALPYYCDFNKVMFCYLI